MVLYKAGDITWHWLCTPHGYWGQCSNRASSGLIWIRWSPAAILVHWHLQCLVSTNTCRQGPALPMNYEVELLSFVLAVSETFVCATIQNHLRRLCGTPLGHRKSLRVEENYLFCTDSSGAKTKRALI